MDRKKDTILFDYDGTVADTGPLILASWQHTFLTIYGREGDESVILRTFGEPLAQSMQEKFPHVDPEEAMKIYRSYQEKHFHAMIQTFPGTRETMAALKARGFALGLVTSRRRSSTEAGLKALGLAPYIDAVVTNEDTTKAKPDPEPALLALAALDARPERAVMVGDTKFDIGCANRAGITSVLVAWTRSFPPEERKGPFAPDHVIEKPGDLLPLADSQTAAPCEG